MAIVPPIRIVRPWPTAIAIFVVVSLLQPAVAAARSCVEWQAELITVEGEVEIRRQADNTWTRAVLQDPLCTGDSLRVLAYSRAALKLPDDTVLRLDANTSLTFEEGDDEAGSLLDLIRGMIHVISRDPRSLKFSTPYVNAGLEGTEFLIAAGPADASVTVLEGEVILTNAAGRAAVKAGEQGIATAAEPPRASPIADALELIRWTSHYASILGGPLPPADVPATALADADFFNRRAVSRLGAGRLAEADADLDRAAAISPGDATTLAIRAMAAARRQNLVGARELADRALSADPRLAAALLASAHVHQAAGDIDAAASEARAATDFEPANATAWARLAELRLAQGNHRESAAAATRALTLVPALAYAHTVLGFAELAALQSGAAMVAFARAVELDAADPLPRLGHALALIQDGQLERGRQELETAVILDPTDGLTRSYMAKAYHTEHRDELSGSQLLLAKEMAPADPTPWLYDALRKATANRPVEALRDLQRAFTLNGRALYRSRLFMDEDLATRSAGFGRLHRDLGFEALALSQGWQSVAANPSDYAGHRLLGDVYSTLPRHEMARVSELYQAQLLQPVNLIPIPPELGEVGQFISQTVAPNELTVSELYPLINRDGIRVQTSAVVAANDTEGTTIALSGLHDRWSYSVGHFGFETSGFRPNNDLDQVVSNALLQYRPNSGTSLQLELRSSDTEKGELLWLFDRETFNEQLRQHEALDTIRAGLRKDGVAGGTLLASLSYRELDLVSFPSEFFSIATNAELHDFDLQLVRTHGRLRSRTGVTFSEVEGFDTTAVSSTDSPGEPPTTLVTASIGGQKASAYGYLSARLGERVDLTLGASADSADTPRGKERRLNPKLGVVAKLGERTTVRAAAFRTLQGHDISQRNAQPRLEPVDVAGFNQLFLTSENEAATRYGLGVDHRFVDTLFGGVELTRRSSEYPVVFFIPPTFETQQVLTYHTDENLHRAYLYWTPTDTIALSAEYQHERFDNHGALFKGYTEMYAQRLPLEARYFHPSGFSASLRGTHVRQSGYFSSFLEVQPEVVADAEYGSDEFWIFDASLGYRLPNRRGVVSLNVGNLFDKRFRFQDTDPQNSEFLPERMMYLRFTLAFD